MGGSQKGGKMVKKISESALYKFSAAPISPPAPANTAQATSA
jgi:hypothetical protein